MEYQEILTRLEAIDLSSYPYDEIVSLLENLGKIGIVITTLHSRKRILRARINYKNESFKNVSELSYKPEKYNTTYQRASTPKKSMFYGSIVPEILGKEEPETARITTLIETSDFVRDTTSIGTQKVTFSVWEVVEDIHLVSLIHFKKFKRPTKLSQQLQNEYSAFIKKHPELEKQSKEIVEFIGKQFAKQVEKGKDYEYMISALFTETILNKNFDGVLYPSVQLEGEGINIAVRSEIIESKIKFIHAGECTVYKNKKSVFVGNDTYAKVSKDGNLEFDKAPDGVFTPKEYGLKQVGLIK